MQYRDFLSGSLNVKDGASSLNNDNNNFVGSISATIDKEQNELVEQITTSHALHIVIREEFPYWDLTLNVDLIN
jgi:hypothetical protein